MALAYSFQTPSVATPFLKSVLDACAKRPTVSIVQSDTVSLFFNENTLKIRSFTALDKNWNGNNAEPISGDVAQAAIKALPHLPGKIEIFPTARNSIQFEFHIGSAYVEFEVMKDRIQSLVDRDGEMAEESFTLETMKQNIKRIIADVSTADK